MGKPNPAKLANFLEVDVFVMIADPLGFLLDSKVWIVWMCGQQGVDNEQPSISNV